MKSKDLHSDLTKYLKKHSLENKFKKQLAILLKDFRHPSLHTEILEPRFRKIYSFRIDQKYRAIFIIRNGEILIIDINDHYA
jgi:plasmid maintenance system killer protein